MTKPGSNEQSVAAAEERLRALLTATSDVIYSMTADWRVMRELDGRGLVKDNHEPITDWQSQNIHPADLEMVRAAIAKAIAEKKIFELEHRVLRADGSPAWTFSRAVPILDNVGEIIEWFGVASDITDRKHAEQALQQQRRLYETVTSNTPDLMYVFDLNYRFTYANSALLTMWGKTWEDAIGKNLLENGYEPWHAEMHEREIDQVCETKMPVRGEVSFPHAVLGRRVYEYIFTPVFDEHGEVEAVAGTTRDVTERKTAEEQLAKSSDDLQAINEEMASINEEMSATNEELAASNEELRTTNEELAYVSEQLSAARRRMEESETALRLALDAASFGTWFIHSVTREFITDARLKELFGYYPDEALSIEQALAQITEEYRGFVAKKLENAIYHNGDYDVTYPVIGLHDQRLRWLRAIGNLKADPSGGFSAFTGVVMDISEQYLAAKNIERAEESLRLAIEAANAGTFSIHIGTFEFLCSPRFKELYGFSAEQDVSYEACLEQIAADHRQLVTVAVEATVTDGARFEMEYPITRFNDQKRRWLRGVGALTDSNGEDRFLTGIIIDITEQKEDEQRKNDFVGMVSHELKTPLTSLTAILQVLQAKLKRNDDQFVPGALDKANIQVKKMAAMINGFLNISRLESGKIQIEKQLFIIGDLIKEAIEEANVIGSTNVIELRTCEKVVVQADREKIASVLSNLLNNAVKYSPKGSLITVNCYFDLGKTVVSVTDEGLGIRPEDQQSIFDRYYRVQSNHTRNISGFGIGLYLSAEIVRRHGGDIWLESESGKGSTFYFSLPI